MTGAACLYYTRNVFASLLCNQFFVLQWYLVAVQSCDCIFGVYGCLSQLARLTARQVTSAQHNVGAPLTWLCQSSTRCMLIVVFQL